MQVRQGDQPWYPEDTIESFVGHSSMGFLCPPAWTSWKLSRQKFTSLWNRVWLTHTHTHTKRQLGAWNGNFRFSILGMAFFCLCFFFNTKKLPVVSSAPGTFLSAPRNEFFRETYVERCLGVTFGEFPKPAWQADNWRWNVRRWWWTTWKT